VQPDSPRRRRRAPRCFRHQVSKYRRLFAARCERNRRLRIKQKSRPGGAPAALSFAPCQLRLWPLALDPWLRVLLALGPFSTRKTLAQDCFASISLVVSVVFLRWPLGATSAGSARCVARRLALKSESPGQHEGSGLSRAHEGQSRKLTARGANGSPFHPRLQTDVVPPRPQNTAKACRYCLIVA
jgi:hypothetical protein